MVRRWMLVLLLIALAASTGCERDVLETDDAKIDQDPLSQVKPDVDRPHTRYPVALHTDNAKLNEFVDKALEVCEQGDYDRFRLLFGAHYEPTKQRAFERMWMAVDEVTVVGVHPAETDPPVYFFHVKVRLREPDTKGRLRRELVVMAFQEAGEWRLGPPPSDVQERILAASTRPADAGSQTQPAT